jgi:hypothetical protein
VALFFEDEVGLARDDTESSKNYLGLAKRDFVAGDKIMILSDLARSGILTDVLGDLKVVAGDQLFIGAGKLMPGMPSTTGSRVVLVGMALNERDILAHWQYIGQVQ